MILSKMRSQWKSQFCYQSELVRWSLSISFTAEIRTNQFQNKWTEIDNLNHNELCILSEERRKELVHINTSRRVFLRSTEVLQLGMHLGMIILVHSINHSIIHIPYRENHSSTFTRLTLNLLLLRRTLLDDSSITILRQSSILVEQTVVELLIIVNTAITKLTIFIRFTRLSHNLSMIWYDMICD